MSTITLEDAQSRLAEVVAGLTPGETVVITQGDAPVARITSATRPTRKPRKAGSAKGILVILQDDDEHLLDFAEYMK